jgi:ATP phosphoribosyltransferase
MESTTRLVANKASMSDKWKKNKIDEIAMLLKGALNSQDMVGLKMNIKREDLAKIIKIIPALKNPTVSDLTDKDWVAIDTIIKEQTVRKLIPQLKKIGAKGIVEYSLNKIIF